MNCFFQCIHIWLVFPHCEIGLPLFLRRFTLLKTYSLCFNYSVITNKLLNVMRKLFTLFFVLLSIIVWEKYARSKTSFLFLSIFSTLFKLEDWTKFSRSESDRGIWWSTTSDFASRKSCELVGWLLDHESQCKVAEA